MPFSFAHILTAQPGLPLPARHEVQVPFSAISFKNDQKISPFGMNRIISANPAIFISVNKTFDAGFIFTLTAQFSQQSPQ
jgi:hypothetical protein